MKKHFLQNVPGRSIARARELATWDKLIVNVFLGGGGAGRG